LPGPALSDVSRLYGSSFQARTRHSRGTLQQRVRRIVLANLLVILTVAGVIVGVIIGMAVRNTELTRTQVIYIGFPGELLIRLLKMIITAGGLQPGVRGGEHRPQGPGPAGRLAMLFFLVTTLLSSSIGVVMAFIIKPGSNTGSKPRVAGLGDDGTLCLCREEVCVPINP
uniref:Amino acid transporter n=1 Tax=Gadus morhua TaxID=8049 RepID=A0A8C5BER7_GADMO